MITTILGSKARHAILQYLLLNPEQEFYLREIVRLTRFAPRTIQKELDNLVKQDLLKERRSGNRRYLKANSEHPLFRSLQELILKSAGFIGVLRDALGEQDIDFALVFGSMASGEAKAGSDIDILIVGDIGLREAVRRLAGIHDQLGREVNPVVWTNEEYQHRLIEKDHFLSEVMKSPHLVIKGETIES